MMGYGHGMGWMWVFWFLLVVGVVVLVIVTARVLGGGVRAPGGDGAPPAAGSPGRSRAREILGERYARGELGTEEYQERLRVLGEGGA